MEIFPHALEFLQNCSSNGSLANWDCFPTTVLWLRFLEGWRYFTCFVGAVIFCFLAIAAIPQKMIFTVIQPWAKTESSHYLLWLSIQTSVGFSSLSLLGFYNWHNHCQIYWPNVEFCWSVHSLAGDLDAPIAGYTVTSAWCSLCWAMGTWSSGMQWLCWQPWG